MTIRQAIADVTKHLTDAGVDAPRTTAQLLLAHLLGKDRTYLLTHPNEPVEETIRHQFRAWASRRAGGVPLQYLIGHQEFYGLDFIVTPDVLIPRPETELVVEEVLGSSQPPAPLIIDVGAGSGCLAVTLAVHLNQARIIALDISPSALKVARLNAQRHGVEDQLLFLASDLFSALVPCQPSTTADFIVANPPYVSEAEFAGLPREVREHEPHVALIAGPDGLALHRRLLTESPAFLRPGGSLIMEMGFGQCDALVGLVEPSTWRLEKILSDLQGLPRTLVLRLVGQN
jgi:release factor glutamine methyltransferase